jgi:hypothetical protein
VKRLRKHAGRHRVGHFANPLDGRNHVAAAGAGEARLVEEVEQIRERSYDRILVILVHFALRLSKVTGDARR